MFPFPVFAGQNGPLVGAMNIISAQKFEGPDSFVIPSSPTQVTVLDFPIQSIERGDFNAIFSGFLIDPVSVVGSIVTLTTILTLNLPTPVQIPLQSDDFDIPVTPFPVPIFNAGFLPPMIEGLQNGPIGASYQLFAAVTAGPVASLTGRFATAARATSNNAGA